MANVLYRGPAGKTPLGNEARVTAGAYLPGILCTDNGTTLTVATASDIEKSLVLLGNRDFVGQDLATAYASGDTAVSYFPQPGEVWQARLANATYALGAALTIGASGYLTAAAAGERVIAWFAGTAGAHTAGQLADVRIANSFNIAP